MGIVGMQLSYPKPKCRECTYKPNLELAMDGDISIFENDLL